MAATTDPAEAIKRLYFAATPQTIARDLERAIALLISLDSDAARQRVAVYMDGLSQMRSEWKAKSGPPPAPPGTSRGPAPRGTDRPAPKAARIKR